MTRITLVLSGSASLGAYTAGATAELLAALEANRLTERVVVDVVTGSSAGALTAAMAARSLVVNPNLAPWIERSWVEAMDARQLLNPARDDRSGWLDPEPVDELMAHLVSGPAASDDRPSEALGEELRVGFSLQSLGGNVDPGEGGGADPGEDGSAAGRGRNSGGRAEAVYRLHRSSGPALPAWADLRRAAVAAASIPVAFPPRPLALGPGSVTGPYVGDGLGAERPVSLARRLASDAAGGERRRVVVVDPASDGAGRGPERPGGPTSTTASLGRALRELLGRGAAEDLMDAADAAGRRRVLAALVERLPEIHGRLEDPDAVSLGRRVGELAERVAEDAVARDPAPQPGGGSDPVLDWLDRHLSRIQADPDYAAAIDTTSSRAGRTRLAKLILVLETIGGLAEAPVADVHPVRPPAGQELAGRSLAGFGGFLERDWRVHDLRAGRRDARRLLEGPLADVVSYEPRDDAAYEPGEVDARLDALRPEARDRLLSFLESEAERALRDLRPGGLAGLVYGSVRSALSRALAERALSELRAL